MVEPSRIMHAACIRCDVIGIGIGHLSISAYMIVAGCLLPIICTVGYYHDGVLSAANTHQCSRVSISMFHLYYYAYKAVIIRQVLVLFIGNLFFWKKILSVSHSIPNVQQ